MHELRQFMKLQLQTRQWKKRTWSLFTFLGKQQAIFLLIPFANSKSFFPFIGIIVSISNSSVLEYDGPPQGGDRKTTSAFNVGASTIKSPQMNSILSSTPQILALFLQYSIFTGSQSTAITLLQYFANCIVFPPHPQKASRMTPSISQRVAMCLAITSGVTENHDSKNKHKTVDEMT